MSRRVVFRGLCGTGSLVRQRRCGVVARRVFVIAVVGILGGAVAGGSARAAGTDTAVAYQVNAAHSGVQRDDSLAPPFSLRWRVSLPGPGPISYPVIAQGLVFVTAQGVPFTPPRLYALDQASGQVVWSQTVPNVFQSANPAYDNGRIFILGSRSCCAAGFLTAYAADTGAQLWRTDLTGQYMFSAPPTAANGVVYADGAGSDGTLYAVDEATGAVLTTQYLLNGGGLFSSPTLSDSSLFVSYSCTHAYALSQLTLAMLWHYAGTCEGPGDKTAAYADGRLFTRDFAGDLIFDANSGAVVGSFESKYIPAVDDSRLYAVSNPDYSPGGTLSAQDLTDASIRWTFTGDGQLSTAPLVLETAAGKFVIEGSASGTVWALAAGTGTVVWTTSVGSTITQPDEQDLVPLTGLAAGQGLLVVPAGNTVSAYFSDTTAPTLSTPTVITARAGSPAGAQVDYAVSASDPDDQASASCAPTSGSTFAIGTTIVDCTATDTAGNSSRGSFLVVVSAPSADCTLADYPTSRGALILKNANLAGCYLPTANLSGANATNANMSGSYLDHANLSGATLSQAQLQRAVLTNADLSNSKLNFAYLSGANLTGTTLAGATWLQTTCPDTTNSGSDGGTCIGHTG